MAQHKRIHYSSVDTPGKKKSVSSFWVSQTKSDFARAWQRSQRWNAQWSPLSLISRGIPYGPGFSPAPLPPLSHPTAGQGSLPGRECIVPTALGPIWQWKWQVGVLLQSTDLNLLLQPAGRAEFNEQVWLHCWKLWPWGSELVRFASSWMAPGQLYCAILQILMPAKVSQRYRLSRGFFSQQLCWLRPSRNACGMPASRKALHSHAKCKTLWDDFSVSCNSAQILAWVCSSLFSSSAQFLCAAAL